ncbi:hypothetical protein FOA43_002155 [Brettanomyces nanus]|uniref:Uncharacterized protein n=1 Tax=Eeniella nana TaxID=13502 RepID=A0A875S4X5_EENNA|nr:uncharacterized protein FOA43_002155 [Brettanomyces nanus]QPG74819.1 hypothetical protein FOA43_002155 [Brettanomyces nanus]
MTKIGNRKRKASAYIKKVRSVKDTKAKMIKAKVIKGKIAKGKVAKGKVAKSKLTKAKMFKDKMTKRIKGRISVQGLKKISSPSSPVSAPDDDLFDDTGSMSDITSSSEYDDSVKKTNLGKKRKRYSKRDFRSCFNSFFQQLNCIPHPSSVKIDIDSEMKLQRQRRLIELDRLRADSDDENDLSDVDNCLDLYERTNTASSQMTCKASTSKTFEKIEEPLSQLTTGLEPVDRIILQAEGCSDEDRDLFKMASETNTLAGHLEISDPIGNDPEVENMSAVKDVSGSCDLISATSFFKSLTDEEEVELPLEEAGESITCDYASLTPTSASSLNITDFLNIDVPPEDDCTTVFHHNTIFPYRYNSDNLNLSLVDDAEALTSQPKGLPALNKRALFYGNSQAMMSNEKSVSIDDFLC